MINVDSPLLRFLPYKLFNLLINLNPLGEELLQQLNKSCAYILTTHSSQCDKSQLYDTGQHILDNIGGLDGIHYAVE